MQVGLIGVYEAHVFKHAQNALRETDRQTDIISVSLQSVHVNLVVGSVCVSTIGVLSSDRDRGV